MLSATEIIARVWPDRGVLLSCADVFVFSTLSGFYKKGERFGTLLIRGFVGHFG